MGLDFYTVKHNRWFLLHRLSESISAAWKKENCYLQHDLKSFDTNSKTLYTMKMGYEFHWSIVSMYFL